MWGNNQDFYFTADLTKEDIIRKSRDSATANFRRKLYPETLRGFTDASHGKVKSR